MNVHADALPRLPAEESKGPDLKEVLGDYYLPLNVIRKETDEGFVENRTCLCQYTNKDANVGDVLLEVGVSTSWSVCSEPV